MNLKPILFLILSSILLSACSSPIVNDVRFDNVTFDPIQRKTIVSAIDSTTQFKIKELTQAIKGLGPNIDKTEASFIAREAVLFSMHLANEYKLVSPPNSQNVLVNTGKREKGLCYHFARDMTDQIVKDRTFNTLTLQRAVSFQGKQFEHNVLTVAAKGKGIKDAIILDAWRDSAKLYWVKTGDDPLYPWSKYTRRTYTLNPQ
ncbi:MAG: hypothetical protein V7749_04495 [Cocleimonas sp.]